MAVARNLMKTHRTDSRKYPQWTIRLTMVREERSVQSHGLLPFCSTSIGSLERAFDLCGRWPSQFATALHSGINLEDVSTIHPGLGR